MNRAYNDGAKHALAIGIMNNEILSAQVDFKIQVQEWKNILLRGKDNEDRERYYSSFTNQEERVQASLKAAYKECISLKLNFDCKQIESFEIQHVDLGSKYKDSLMGASLDNYEAIHKLDQSVRGSDRELEAKMDKLSLELLGLQNSEREATKVSLNDRYESLRKFILIVMTLALTLTVFSLYSVIRATSD